ncbi:hypothetical protein SODALDRAFT_332711 [Sodiomyces alkalinus F11]|uniref:LCCL domain-containing protein n=1 Tax=Sodiomyces alkalinus (strain CBS 110278 / VKM F-3762 / F11) TaxID=1314773 RepID=A0A3N2PXL0_SODAK|nr:hypothetical protein SODALDRAFT_332711 [Sodiomyces alkalinus F11]ROT39269.1 hypothetical protein SODALDRAFT_332711 [Sodiomyces alkalinus F11]
MVNEDRNVEITPLLTDMERRQEAAERPADALPKKTPLATPTELQHPDDTLDDDRDRTRGDQLELENSFASTPRFMQDQNDNEGQGPSKRWKWVPYPIRRLSKAASRWAKGPPHPKQWKIEPFFPRVQQSPLWLVDKFVPRRRQRFALVFIYLAVWIVTFALVKREETFASDVAGWGEPRDIGCGATYWAAGNRCGLHGNDCRPFNGSGFAFRCAASCRDHRVLNPRAVGDQEIIYQPFVIGGPGSNDDDDDDDDDASGMPVYRGDSFICPAAIHAGVVSNTEGGCGVVRLVGQHEGYVGSSRNGIDSISFDSHFPLSFTFEPDVSCRARDMRWDLLAVSVVFSSVLSLFTSSSALFFFASFVAIFWHVGMASDQPQHNSIPGLVSTVLGRFLPAMFCAWVMYDKMGVRRTLRRGLTAQVEKTVLWLGACWVGALTNYTLDFIPISRLTAHDLNQQPGAQAALAVIVIVLFCIVVVQAWFFQQEGRFLSHLQLYGLFLLGIVIAIALPGLELRIHHYILALLLLPGTSMQTRPSLLYQGLLIGLFINGIARWGFDPVLQTPAALQGDAQHNSPLPVVLPPVIDLGHALWTINLTWAAPHAPRYDGISVLVNDVERFRGYYDDDGDDVSLLDRQRSFVWTRDPELRLNEYFRFGYMEGSRTWDYTRAGVWNAEGGWVEMPPGPSKVRVRREEEEADEHLVQRKRRV